MKRSSVFIVVAIIALFFNYGIMAQPTNKVEICHHPPGNTSNYQTISISMNALQAHLAHGDVIGSCLDDEIEIVIPVNETATPMYEADPPKDYGPSYGQINIEYNLYRPSSVKIDVYDRSGNKIQTIEPDAKIVGKHTHIISHENLGSPTGMCYVKVSVTNKFGTISKSTIVI